MSNFHEPVPGDPMPILASEIVVWPTVSVSAKALCNVCRAELAATEGHTDLNEACRALVPKIVRCPNEIGTQQ